jgi:4-oxalocrotonate tautomerase
VRAGHVAERATVKRILREEGPMPHILVKVVSGKSEEQKSRLAEEITKDVIDIFNTKEESVTVAFEEVEKQDWMEKVYRPHIQEKWGTLYKKPGYGPS